MNTTRNPESTDSLRKLEELLKRTESVDPFTPEFSSLIGELFPDSATLKQNAEGDNKHTVHLLEREWRTREQSIDPQYIIRMIKSGEARELLREALLSAAAKTLYTRCEKIEMETPII